MLIKLRPEQVEEGWDLFAPLIQKAIPPQIAVREGGLANILRAILAEEATAWVEVDLDKGAKALIITTVDYEPVIGARRLVIWSLTIFGDPGDVKDWKEAITTLKKHARGLGCKYILSFVNDKKYARYLSMVGAEFDSTLMTFEV